jgi:hypothetical protein
MNSRSILHVSIIIAAAILLSGCSSVRSRLGLGDDGDAEASTAASVSPTQSRSEAPEFPRPTPEKFPKERDQRMIADAALRQAIARNSANVPARERARAEKRFAEAAKRVDDEVKMRGDASVADRLAGEFRLSPESLLDEKITYDVAWHDEERTYDASWGEIMIAHTLADRSKIDVTAKQLLDLRRNRYPWWKIAAGLELDLAQAITATSTNADLALGREQAP